MFKKSRNLFIASFTLILIVSCYKTTEGLRPSDIQILVREFLARHVEYQTLNNEISERTLNNFLNNLDYGKYYFHQKDIDEFMKHRLLLDDYIVQNQFSFVFKIFKRYKERFNESMAIADQLIDKNYDYSKDETITVDRNLVKFAKNSSELKDRWRKNIKLQLLNYISIGKSKEEARLRLRKRYTRLKRRMDKMDEEAVLSQFMNAFSMALDPHSNYLTADANEDFKISMQLKLEGIGVRLRQEEGFVIVDAIIPGGRNR